MAAPVEAAEGPVSAPELARRLAGVREGLMRACAAAGRDPASVRLVAVSKIQPAAAVAAVLRLGQLDFGENYAQELRDKSALLQAEGAAPRWHFIGPLQRNKVPLVVGRAALIHSVDSLALLEALAARVARVREKEPAQAALVQECLIEVSLAGESQKAGCEPHELPALLDAFANLGGTVRCLGLMCMPPLSDDAEASRPHFRRLRELLGELGQKPRPHVELRELSMGMSHDYPVAIAEGATLVRVGTAIFGARPSRAASQ